MTVKKEIPIYDFVYAISEAVDMVSPVLNRHHKKVAYVAYRIAQEMLVSGQEIQDIVLASMLHDIGAFSTGERLKLLAIDCQETECKGHAMMGYNLLKGFAPLAKAARLVKYHHTDYEKSSYNIPMGSCIIHLADRICVLFDEKREILSQVPVVLEKIAQQNHKFHPETLFAFGSLARLEYFWFEALSPSFGEQVLKRILFSKKIVKLETLRDFAKVVAQIIDFRSRFTATHSSGVAAVAMDLADISGYSEGECKMMEIAGFLHDLGKLAVPNDILEKNGKLEKEEFNAIRKHTYYTHAVLSKIEGLEHIATWASHHHERQDGNGYPFHVKDEDFPSLARLMAVADVFTALTEDRPYRLGMDRANASEVLFDMAGNVGIDMNIVKLANKNFYRLNDTRLMAQAEARNEYKNFHETTGNLMTKAL